LLPAFSLPECTLYLFICNFTFEREPLLYKEATPWQPYYFK
jgi:hypothetical protein